jgi:PAS domain S-box-containing protein
MTDSPFMHIQLPAALEVSEQALEEVFRHTPVGVVLTDLHGTILDANVALCAMLGRRREEVVERPFAGFIHPDEQDAARFSIGRLRGEEVDSVETVRRWIAGDGHIVTTRLTASIVRSKDGEPICGIAFVEDIGERLEMENALRESEARYRRVVEDQTELIVRSTPDGTRTFVNDAYCRYNNATAEELLGTSFFPCIPDDEREMIVRKFAALTPARPVITDEHLVTAPDGSLRWHRWTDRGFFDAAGTLVEIQAVGSDITEEREAHERRLRSEENYHRLYSALPVAVWETDFSDVLPAMLQQGIDTPEKLIAIIEKDPAVFFALARHTKAVTANDAALTLAGASEPSAVFAWMTERYTLEAALNYARAAAPLLLGDLRVVDIELPLQAADGGKLVFMQRLARLPNWPAEPRLIAITLDVTEQRRLEQVARQEREAMTRADKLISLGVLVSGVAHEINNPNHSIMLNAPLLRDAWKGILPIVDEHAARDGETRIGNLPWAEMRAEGTSMIDDIEHAAERIRGIVTELRNFALDHDPGERRAVAMNDVVTSSLRLLGTHIRKATTRFSTVLTHELPAVHANQRRLEQVLVNLIINACQAIESAECALVIETGRTPTHVFARVTDEGRGISRDDLRHIKDPFFTTKRATGGSGLGLAVSDRIAQEHGGELTFESEPGRGTSATLSIPIEAHTWQPS